jgi:hypothetical protein
VSGGRTTLVGGLPWADSPGPAAVPGMPVIDSGTPPTALSSVARGDPGHEPPAGLAERIEDLVRLSPPFSVSLAVHVVVLLVLALIFVRSRRDDRVALEVSFLSTEVTEAPDPGVMITPEPEPVPEPEPEVVKSEKPPVEEPTAAPPVMAVPAEAPGAVAVEAVAPAIGTLLNGREEGRRAALVDAYGGSTATEAAVAKALEWLVRQQDKKDGLWSLRGPYADGGSQENRLSATAMALLAFQGAGNTPHEGRYQKVVERGWKALVTAQHADGSFDVAPEIPHLHRMYSHAQATIAACELSGMTRDAGHAEVARRATAFAVAAQLPDGGWRYAPPKPGDMTVNGDMSVTGWYVMALKSAEMAGIAVPRETFQRVEAFLDSVAFEDGARYGYMRYKRDQPPLDDTSAVSAEGLLARQFLGWKRDDPRITAGVRRLLAANMPVLHTWATDDRTFEMKDAYAWYYITQVVHHAGGESWKLWNGRMKEVLTAKQVRAGREVGSWDPSLDRWGVAGGRLFETCFFTWMLEVYYRHLPLYGDEAVSGAETP